MRRRWITEPPASPSGGHVIHRHSFAACFVNLIHGDIDNAFPVFERTFVALVTRTAGKPALDDDVFAAKRSVTVTAGRSKNRNDGRTNRGGEVHWTGVSAHKEPGFLAQSNQFVEIRGHLMNAIAAGSHQRSNHVFLARPPRDGHRQSVSNEPAGQFSVAIRMPNFRDPVSSGI